MLNSNKEDERNMKRIQDVIKALIGICIICTMFGGYAVKAEENIPDSIPLESSIVLNEPFLMGDWNVEPETKWRFSKQEEEWLAKLMVAEAEGEGDIGMELVVLVVLNRVQSEDFPDTIQGVIFEKGQFSCMYDGRFQMAEPTELCYELLADVQCEYMDWTNGALYFCTKTENQWHRNYLDYLLTYKHHELYK